MTLNLFGKWKWNNWLDKKEISGSHSPIASDHISAVANSGQSEVFGGRSKKKFFRNWQILLKKTTYISLKSGWSDRLRNRFWSKNIYCRPDIPGMSYLPNNKKGMPYLPLQRSSTLSLNASSSASVSRWAEARETERRRSSMVKTLKPTLKTLKPSPDNWCLEFVPRAYRKCISGRSSLYAGAWPMTNNQPIQRQWVPSPVGA